MLICKKTCNTIRTLINTNIPISIICITWLSIECVLAFFIKGFQSVSKKNLINTIFNIGFTSVLMTSGLANAACGDGSAVQIMNISMGDLVIQRDEPVGSVLKTVYSDSYKSAIACNDGSPFMSSLSLYNQSAGIDGVYKTNISGVGIRLSSNGSNYPFALATGPGKVYFGNTKVELVKYGTTGAGALTAGRIGNLRYLGYPGNPIAYVNLLSSNVLSASCSVAQQTTNVTMGNVNKDYFNNLGSLGPIVGFSIALNCPVGTNVKVTIDGRQDPSGITGVLALNSQQGTASGVGIQISYNNNPIAIGGTINYGTTTVDGNYSIPFIARYYRTSDSLIAGKADSTATFTMAYN